MVLRFLFATFLILTLGAGQYAFAGTPKSQDGESMKELQGELLIASSETKAIQQLKRLIAKHKGSSLEAGLWFRLGEMYLRRAKTARFFEMNRENDSVVRFAPGIVKNSTSRGHILEAIQMYDMIQSKFPKFSDMDMVYFNNAFSRQQVGQNDQAKVLYRKLVSQFPESSLVPDSYLALGEMYFDGRDFKQALIEFEAIKKFPESRVYIYGIYKTAWTYYNLQQTEKGIRQLELVVAKGDDADSKMSLRKEALSDMVLFYSELFPAKDAFSYFYKQAGKSDVGLFMLKLAKLYSHHSRFKDLEIVLIEYIDQLPKSREIPRAHDELISTYEIIKNRKSAIYEMKRLGQVCQPKSNWSLAQLAVQDGGDSDQMKTDDPHGDCRRTFQTTTSKLAAQWHKIWLKDKSNNELGDATEQAYELYMGSPADEEKRAKARFNFAEMLFQRSKYRQASHHYSLVGQITKDAKMGHDAVYGALVSLETAVKGVWNDQDETTFKNLVAIYFKSHSKGPYLSELQFKQAFIAYEKKKYDEAGPQFKKLALENPKAPKALKAQDLYLDVLNIKKDFKELRQFSLVWSKQSGDSERKAKLTKIYQEAYFADIQKVEENKNYSEAVAEYKKFVIENATSPLADKAWWNATQLEFKIGHLKDGAASLYKFYQLFPKSPKAKEALVQAAQTYELMGQLKSAAEVLQDLAKLDSKDAEKWLLIAANFKVLSGSVDSARQMFLQLGQSAKREIAQPALTALAELESKAGRREAYSKVVADVVRRGFEPLASQVQYEKVKQAHDRGDFKAAFKLASDLVGDKSASKFTKSGARFIQARILEEEFRVQSIKTSAERVAVVLAIKTEKLEKAQRAYQDVIRMGEAEFAIESLRRLSAAYDHFVQAVRKIQITEKMNDDELVALEEELEKLTAPIEEKSVDSLNEALKQARKFELRDGKIAEIQLELNKLNKRSSQIAEYKVDLPPMVVPKLNQPGSAL